MAHRGLLGGRFDDRLTEDIIGACIEVHRHLGPGLLESVYEACLCHELDLRGRRWVRQVPVPVAYKGVLLECGYRVDLIVEDRVVLELKSTGALLPIHAAQMMTYLKLTRLGVGLLINFNVHILRYGIRRITLKANASSMHDD